MELYRLKNWLHPSIQYGYRLEIREFPGLVQQCYVDFDALESLNRLVAGPIRSVSDLVAAERALRAIIFHERIELLRPSIKVQQIIDPYEGPKGLYVGQNAHPAEPLVLNCAEKTKDIDAISSILTNIQSDTLCTVEQLFGFPDKETANRAVDAQLKRSEEARRNQSDMEKEAISLISTTTAEFEFVASGADAYFSNAFLANDEVIKSFVRPVPETGLLSYFGKEEVRGKYESVLRSMFRRTPFFDAIDEQWRPIQENMAFTFKVPLPWLTSIILARSGSRQSIPSVIKEFRQEFEGTRNQLWGLMEEGGWRTAYPKNLVEIDRLEKAAAQAIPKKLQDTKNGLSFSITALGRILLQDWIGASAQMLDWFEKLKGSGLHQVDAATVVNRELSDADLQAAIQRHLTPQEIENLQRP